MTGYMEKQLEELKAQMERSAGALANLEKDLDVINPEEKTNVFSARLDAPGQRPHRRRSGAGGQRGGVQRGEERSLPAAEASDQGEQLRPLETRLNEATEKLAEVQTQFGSAHPIYKKAASQVNRVAAAD